MKLKIQDKKVIHVSDWNDFVEKIYGRPYNLQQQDGCKNRGVEYLTVPVPEDELYDFEDGEIPEEVNGPEMGVSFNAWLARDPKKPIPVQRYDWELELWWERNFYPTLETVANDLHQKGLLEAGQYLIIIDW